MTVELEHQGCGPYTLCNRFEPEIFTYTVQMPDETVSGEKIQWCLSNCEGKWSWYFHKKYAWLSFENIEDHLLFSVIHR